MLSTLTTIHKRQTRRRTGQPKFDRCLDGSAGVPRIACMVLSGTTQPMGPNINQILGQDILTLSLQTSPSQHLTLFNTNEVLSPHHFPLCDDRSTG